MHKVREYLDWGGFPELLLYSNKRKWLNQLYEKIVLGDIILRNGIKNELGLRLTYKRLAESLTKHEEEGSITLTNGKTVATIPLWKWLLQH